MLDPMSAIAMATSAYGMVTRMVAAGREFEDTAQQLGKWFGAVSDLRRAEQENKNPPLFKKLFASGSIEEESLALLMHTKKIAEQEKELRTLLMYRYGSNAWEELMTMRRQIAKQRQDTIYRQQELRQNLIDGIMILSFIVLASGMLIGMVYWVGVVKYWW
jgi:replicative DNA helicase